MWTAPAEINLRTHEKCGGSQWPRCLRSRSVAARLLILSSNPTGGMDVCLLWVLSDSTDCGASFCVCDLQTSWMRRSWPTGGRGIRRADFRATHNNSTDFCARPLYRILYKSGRNFRKYSQNFIYVLKLSKALMAPINHLQTKRRPLYLKTQSVPRCKHFSSGL